MGERRAILVTGWSGRWVCDRVIAALGGVDGDRVEVPFHLHGLSEPPTRSHRRRGVTLTLEDLIEQDELEHERHRDDLERQRRRRRVRW